MNFSVLKTKAVGKFKIETPKNIWIVLICLSKK